MFLFKYDEAQRLGMVDLRGEHGNPLHGNPVFLLEHPTDRGAWWAVVRKVTKSQT